MNNPDTKPAAEASISELMTQLSSQTSPAVPTDVRSALSAASTTGRSIGTALIVDRLRWNAARLPVKPSRRLLEFPVVLQWLASEALPNFVADKRNNGSHVHNFAHPSRYCDLKTVRRVIVVRAACFGRHRRVGPKADAPPAILRQTDCTRAARRRGCVRQAWASFESRSSKVTSIRSKPLARWAFACPA